MELSRSAQKRQREQLEKLAAALVALPAGSLAQIPCSDEIREEIRAASAMKAGARQRLIKYVVKLLEAAGDAEVLYRFIAAKRDGKNRGLAEERTRQELEQYRNALIDEALAHAEATRETGAWNAAREHWESPTLAEIRQQFPHADGRALLRLAASFAATRNPRHSREIFRLLKAASRLSEEGRQSNLRTGASPEGL